jgi:uncharacterized protein (TIGR03118 family)
MRSVHTKALALVAIVYGCSSPAGSTSSGKASTAAGENDYGATPASSESADGGASASRPRIALVVEREDIVSNQPGAKAQDPDLKNAWGLAFSTFGTAWVSAAETGLSPVYDEDGKHVIPTVTIPIPAGGTAPSHPTGQVFNGESGNFKGDAFIFVTEDGTISGWQPSDITNAVLRVDNSASEAIYKGVTHATHASGERLYATNFHAGTIEVYDANYARVDSAGAFQDPQIPDGFAPFNVKAINGSLFVTYAKQDDDKEDDVKGAGFGYVDVYDLDGTLMSRLVSGGALNAPWGLALAPQGYGSLGGRLLVGNFGDGKINVYKFDLSSAPAVSEGVLGDEDGDAMVVDGLWALEFGLGAGGFSTTDLYFTAGPNDEEDGVFGELDAKGQTTTQ